MSFYKRYLYVSYFNHKHSGYGHFLRALKTALYFSSQKRHIDIIIVNIKKEYTHTRKDFYAAEKIFNTFSTHIDMLSFSKYVKLQDSILSYNYSAVFLDTKEMPLNLYKTYNVGLTIGIDMGGQSRKHLDYIIDTLPNTFSHSPNLYAPGMSTEKIISKKRQDNILHSKVLCYIHAYAKENDIKKMIEMFEHSHIRCHIICSQNWQSVLIKGHNKAYRKKNIIEIPFTYSIVSTMHQYDYIITHFGLTAFEALRSSVPVILTNPSKYHNTLSSIAKFKYYFNSYTNSAKKLIECSTNNIEYQTLVQECKNIYLAKTTLSLPQVLQNTVDSFEGHYKSYGKHIKTNKTSFPFLTKEKCKGLSVILRLKNRTVFFNKKTKIYTQLVFVLPRKYNKEYFFNEYKSQYGKTYLEDMSHIESLMKDRIQILEKMIPRLQAKEKKDLRLLDIGCAYGAMISALQKCKNTYDIAGIDINPLACKYVKNTFNSPATPLNAFSEGFLKDVRIWLSKQWGLSKDDMHAPCDIITCWYVAEHAPLVSLLFSHIHSLLAVGGICALSVPNGVGISARINRKRFLLSNPIDHFHIFTPKGLIRLLENTGFIVKKIRITGHHMERLFSSQRTIVIKNPVFSNILYILSKVFKLGETFEIYVEKLP